MRDFVDHIRRLDREKGILATIVHVEGSAYRREGAKMLFTPSGKQFGTLSAGCLEEDLLFRAEDLIKRDRAEIFTYDMTSDDDLSWGTGSGCNGKIDVLLEPVQWNRGFPLMQESAWPVIGRLLKQRASMAAVRRLDEGDSLTATLLITGDREMHGTLGNPLLDQEAAVVGQDFLHSGEKPKKVMLANHNIPVFLDRYVPKDRLFVFGAGPDAIPVVELVARTGFEVTVIDPRPAYCNEGNFPRAERLIVAHKGEAFERVNITSGDYVIMMTHNFNRDQELLNELLQNPPYYLGILGSRQRTLRLLEGKEMPGSIHSPVGLDIGAEGPEQIAVSIVAELIELSRKRGIVG